MADKIFKIYAYIFAKPFFRFFNTVLFKLALRGLGFYNYQNNYLTGEKYFRNKIFNNRGCKIIFDIGCREDIHYAKISKNKIFHYFEPNPIFYKNCILIKKFEKFFYFSFLINEFLNNQFNGFLIKVSFFKNNVGNVVIKGKIKIVSLIQTS